MVSEWACCVSIPEARFLIFLLNYITKMQKLGNGYQSLKVPFLGKYLLTALQNYILSGLIPFYTGGHLVARV